MSTFKLTTDNYFSPDRPHISNSQIGDYLKDPAYYKAKHIDRTIDFKVTDAMKKGSLVDALLTQPGNNPYQLKVLSKDDKELFIEQKQVDDRFLIPASYFLSAFAIAEHIEKQPFWQEGLSEASFQVLLEGELEGMKVCGLADRIDRTGAQTWRISDVKVVSSTKTESKMKWTYNAFDMGYIRQAALYRYLWGALQGVPIENVEFAHIVGTQVVPGYCRVNLYKIDPVLMDDAMKDINMALDGIKAKKFSAQEVEWNDQELI